MNYNFNGKNIRIPDAEIEKNMKLLNISQDEAIQMWLEDEDFIKNETVEELTKKAKANKINREAKSDKPRKNTKKERKPDDVKREIISTIAQNLDRACCGEGLDHPSNIQIVKPEKEITFILFGEDYSVTLTKHRKPKGK